MPVRGLARLVDLLTLPVNWLTEFVGVLVVVEVVQHSSDGAIVVFRYQILATTLKTPKG